LRGVAFLAALVVDVQAQGETRTISDLLARRDQRDGRRAVEAFRQTPRLAALLGFGLPVAQRQVQAHGKSQDVVQRLLGWNRASALADDHDQLHLVVHLAGVGG